MPHINLETAQIQLAELIQAVRKGEDVTITVGGKPAARLVPVDEAGMMRWPGSMKGKLTVPDDFDTPLPIDVQSDFEGR